MNVIKYRWKTNESKVTLHLVIKIKGELDTTFQFTDFDTPANRERMLNEAVRGILWLNNDGLIEESSHDQ